MQEHGDKLENNKNVAKSETDKEIERKEDNGIIQVIKSDNKIYIEAVSIFTNIEDIVKKYIDRGYSKENINIIISDYNYVIIPITKLEEMREQLKDLTSDVGKNDSQIEKFVKVILSIRKNISYAFEKTKNRNIGNSRNFIEGLTKGRCVCTGYSLITKAALEMVGIKSLVVYNDIHAWNVINLNNTWYHIDMANTKAETLSVNNIGKCLKSDKQLQKNKLYRDNDCQVKCSENPSKDLITQINKTARKVKNNTPKMQKQRKSFREIFRKIFGKKEQTLSLPETVEEKEQEQIINL